MNRRTLGLPGSIQRFSMMFPSHWRRLAPPRRMPLHTTAIAFSHGAPSRPQKPFFVTTPIFYVNGSPHLGHLYSSLMADAIARYHRMHGREVLFTSGTDEHGAKVRNCRMNLSKKRRFTLYSQVQASAVAKGLDPQIFCDQVSHQFRSMLDDFDVSYDDFIRTTEQRHVQASSLSWLHMSCSLAMGLTGSTSALVYPGGQRVHLQRRGELLLTQWSTALECHPHA